MKTLILFYSILFSFITFAGTTPTKVVLWGSMPPSAAKPGDAIHFLAMASGGSDIEYRFLSSIVGNPQTVIKDWGPDNFVNTVLPLSFTNITYFVEARGVGESFKVSASQTFGFLKDIELSVTEINAGEFLTISHPLFQIGQSYNVNFSSSTGFSQTVASNAQAGMLQVSVPSYNGKVSVFVENIATRKRPLLLIHPSDGQTPIANFTFVENPIGSGIIYFDASSSSDPDGTIASYQWLFDDQAQTGSGKLVNHSYVDYRIYNVKLTVKDNLGNSKSVTKSVDLRNKNPISNFSFSNQGGFKINFNGLASSDIDGWITGYQWNFGDGQVGSGAQINHTYATDGNFQVTLTVTDNAGGTNSLTKTVSSSSSTSLLPIANFSLTPETGSAPLSLIADANSSYLPGHENYLDHGIVSCVWSYAFSGKGKRKNVSLNNKSNSCIANFNFPQTGTYTISVTVTAVNGKVASLTKTIAVTPTAPIAEFSMNPLTGNAPFDVTIDASASYFPGHEGDADRGIVNCQYAIATVEKNLKLKKIKSIKTNNCEPGGQHFYLVDPGSYNITLTVIGINGQMASKTKTLIVDPSLLPGAIRGITFRKNIGIVGNVPLVLTFTSDNSIINAVSDANGQFTLYLPLSGDYVLTAEDGDSQSKVTGTLDAAHAAHEVSLEMTRTGGGKVSGVVQLIGNNQPANETKAILKFFASTDEFSATSDVNGNFSFENLPLLGNFYIVFNHPATGSRSTFFSFIDDSTPEQNSIDLSIGSSGTFMSLMNSAFASANFDNWFGFGDNVLIPQSTAISKLKSSPPQSIDYKLGLASLRDREKYNLPPRSNLKSKSWETSTLSLQKTLPCENSYLSAVTANVGTDATGGQLFQDITIDSDAETLVGRIRLLTNETLDAAAIGYNDTFLLTLSNSIYPRILYMGDVSSTTWITGILGYKYVSGEIPIAINVKDLAGTKATLAALVSDRGDLYGDSAMIISNFQILKTSDRHFVETGSIHGNTFSTKNVGAVSWIKMKNTKRISSFFINNRNYSVLRKNEEIDIPLVQFGNEPMINSFNILTLNSSDIFTYSLDSTWVSSMPTSVCLGGGR